MPVFTESHGSSWVCGILIGGRSRRFLGHPKGLLTAPSGQPIVVQLERRFRLARPDGEVVLLGQHPAYAHLGLPMVGDEAPGLGPMAGLLSLLRLASARPANALLLACDLPHLSCDTLAHLIAHFTKPAACVRLDGVWQPMLSLYDAPACLPMIEQRVSSGRLGLSSALAELGARAIPLDGARSREVTDWDHPSDVC